ncbi:MRG/MORF4L-binding protein isoform X2 [Oryctolagus cuniculus]|uniref:MRG/MORF4L-binding protein isoform X2 n=1 Tax=Oryctolagus cuniculus TaxID=9986 RepID=UPI0038792ADA
MGEAEVGGGGAPGDKGPGEAATSPAEETVVWSPEVEVCLFHAMLGHKPVGVNRHFHMICIRDKFSQNIGRQVPSKVIWDHLSTMYDMQALFAFQDLLKPRVPLPCLTSARVGDPSVPESREELRAPGGDHSGGPGRQSDHGRGNQGGDEGGPGPPRRGRRCFLIRELGQSHRKARQRQREELGAGLQGGGGQAEAQPGHRQGPDRQQQPLQPQRRQAPPHIGPSPGAAGAGEEPRPSRAECRRPAVGSPGGPAMSTGWTHAARSSVQHGWAVAAAWARGRPGLGEPGGQLRAPLPSEAPSPPRGLRGWPPWPPGA